MSLYHYHKLQIYSIKADSCKYIFKISHYTPGEPLSMNLICYHDNNSNNKRRIIIRKFKNNNTIGYLLHLLYTIMHLL